MNNHYNIQNTKSNESKKEDKVKYIILNNPSTKLGITDMILKALFLK